ncbi:MAG: hypothetical protein ABI193_16620 [Minicystis sp.]
MRPARSPTLRAVGLLLAALLLAAGCAEPDPHTPVDPAARARLAQEGETGLRALGKDRFEVLDFQPGDGKRLDLCDTFLFHTRLYALGFTARLRFLARVDVPAQSELDARIGAPGWTIEESEDALTLHEVLGEGAREIGREEAIHASAMFLDLEPGLRFERIDRAR